MSKIKNFKDLVFIPHPIAGEAQKLPLYLAKEYAEAKQAKMNFENGYGISVIFGSMFYSNGIDTYEVGILKDGILCYATPITDDVIGYITADEVTDIMRKFKSYQLINNNLERNIMNDNNTHFLIDQPKAVAQLVHEYTKSVIPVFKSMNWLQRIMIKLCFGLRYEKLKS